MALVNTDLPHTYEEVVEDDLRKDFHTLKREVFSKLEVLGDRYFDFIILELCINEYPDFEQKQINQLYGEIKSNMILAEVADEIGLGRLITHNSTSEYRSMKVIADAYEASTAILWLTAGRDKTYEWVQKLFKATNHGHLLLLNNAIVNFEKWAKEVFNIEPFYTQTEIEIQNRIQHIVKVFLSDNFITESQRYTLKEAKEFVAKKALKMALEGRIKLD